MLEPVHALQFNRCVDSAGNVHYTNLPLSTLDANCEQKEGYYSLRLKADYRRLHREIDNPQPRVDDDEQDGALDKVKQKLTDMMDPDQALEELL